jgi:hypothetical protein
MFLASSRRPEQHPSCSPKVEMYARYLTDEGFAPQIQEGGIVMFKKEGGIYLIMVDDNDGQFFRIMFPGLLHIESEDVRRKAITACNSANTATKVAKFFVMDDNVHGSIELFLGEPEDFKPVFNRSIAALVFGVSSFAQAMREGKS